MPRILLLEDEETLRHAIKLNLEAEGHEVVEAVDGQKALRILSEQHIDLAILDIMVPKINGLEVGRNMRINHGNIAFIFLSARGQGADRVEGLKAGAADYISKPFHLEEFLLRVQNVLASNTSMATHDPASTYVIGTCSIDLKNYEATTIRGERVRLSSKETSLLKMLIQRKNEVVSRKEILQHIWGYDVYPSTRTIDNFILAFRKYFEVDSRNPTHFISVRGVGYKFCD